MKQSEDNFKEVLRRIANILVVSISSHWSLLFFFALMLIWLCVGFWLDFSESWQIILHISLAIVTFMMVLLIQHIQHRETRSMQIKLDELLKGVEGDGTHAFTPDGYRQQFELIRNATGDADSPGAAPLSQALSAIASLF